MSDAEFVFDEKQWDDFVKRVRTNLSPETTNKIIEATAYRGLKKIVSIMPHRTGALGRSWSVMKEAAAEYRIASSSKVALFIEEGTKAHGPRYKKFLYIPLRPGAATWRKGFVFGKDYILVKRVKGIKARKYLKPVSQEIFGMMINDFEQHLRTV